MNKKQGDHTDVKPVVPLPPSPAVVALKKERLCLMQRVESAKVRIQELDREIARAEGSQ